MQKGLSSEACILSLSLEQKIKEDVNWAQQALQTAAKLYNEYVDHIGLVTKNRTAVMVGGLRLLTARGSVLNRAY